MKISSEIPVKYLDRLGHLNDFPFIINIYRNNPKYRDYYIEACMNSDYSFLDSGFFENWENGTDFPTDIKALEQGVELFHPTYVFSEEKFGDWEYTVNKSKEFKQYFGKRVKIATCVHGATFEDVQKCYNALLCGHHCDLIAFSHKFAFHNDYIKEHPYLKCSSKDLEYSLVRIDVVSRLLNSSWFTKPVHLLGCNNPIEIKVLGSSFNCILSADTSSPIVYGAENKTYNPIGVLPEGKIHQGKNYIDIEFPNLEDEERSHFCECSIEYNFEWLKGNHNE